MRSWRLTPGLKRSAEHLGVALQVPGVGLAARELGAVDARLLSGADADHLAADGVADRVRLRVLERDQPEQEVALGSRRRARRPATFSRSLAVTRCALRSCVRRMPKISRDSRSGGSNAASACSTMKPPLFLALQDLQRGGLVARRDDAVRDRRPSKTRRCRVDHVRERHEVAERALRIGAARAHVGEGRRA